MNQGPKVSIVIPIYNVERYLDRCLHSILNQSLKDIEIILVDDESPDKCPELCNQYALTDNRIKVIHQKNMGLGLSRNSGMNIATGEYIAFVDSDDWIELTMYETLYKIAKKENFDAVFCGFSYVFENGKIVKRQEFNKIQKFTEKSKIKELLLDLLAPNANYPSDVKLFPSSCRAIYKRSVIKKNNILFNSERIATSEDLLFNADFLFVSESICLTPYFFYNYFKRNNTISTNYQNLHIERYKFFLKIVNIKYKSFFTEKIYLPRLKRHTQHCLRICLFIQYKISKVNGDSIKRIISSYKKLIEDPIFKTGFENYPYKELPLKHKLFYIAVKHKLYPFLLFISSIKKI